MNIIDRVINDLADAIARFRYYETCHREKGTEDGDKKAEVNAEMADRLSRTLQALKAAFSNESH